MGDLQFCVIYANMPCDNSIFINCTLFEIYFSACINALQDIYEYEIEARNILL